MKKVPKKPSEDKYKRLLIRNWIIAFIALGLILLLQLGLPPGGQ